jgi:hypothetical protein
MRMEGFDRRHFLKLAAVGMGAPALERLSRSGPIADGKEIILTEEALRIHRTAIEIGRAHV